MNNGADTKKIESLNDMQTLIDPHHKKPLRRAKTVGDLTQQNVDTIAELEKISQLERTTGEILADKFASMVGSWKFIILQSTLLIIWVIFNIVAWAHHWDPYPFILLNLVLSFQAAYASPIIMMSQNRQAKIDERRNRLDLQINLLAEQENTEILRMLRKLCKKLEIEIHDSTLTALEQNIKPGEIYKEIEESVEVKQVFK